MSEGANGGQRHSVSKDLGLQVVVSYPTHVLGVTVYFSARAAYILLMLN